MYTRWLPILTLTILIVKYLYKEEEQKRRLPDLPEPCLMVLMKIIKIRYKEQGEGSQVKRGGKLDDLPEPCLMVLMKIIKMRYKGQGEGSQV